MYESPTVDIIEVEVEQGFAISTGSETDNQFNPVMDGGEGW